MDRFDEEEKKILTVLGFDVSKKELTTEDIKLLDFKITELYTMYGFDDDAQITELGEIYSDMLDKLY